MRRKLTGRELTLLAILFLLVVVSAYYLWFYVPVTEEIEVLKGQIEDTRTLLEVQQARLERKRAMEKELEELFAENPDPVAMAPYDNSRNVMFELNTILSQTDYYSLNFSTVDTGQGEGVVRRNISLQFEVGGYETAEEILRQLHDNPNRCMLDNLSVTVSEGGSSGSWWQGVFGPDQPEVSLEDTNVQVAGTIRFFEYLKQEE